MPEPSSSFVRTCRREALLCGAIFVVAITYTLWYCVTHGYDRSEESLSFVLGFPDWVFYGILCPWAVCTVIAALFSFVIMQDYDLGRAEPPPAADVAADSDAKETGND